MIELLQLKLVERLFRRLCYLHANSITLENRWVLERRPKSDLPHHPLDELDTRLIGHNLLPIQFDRDRLSSLYKLALVYIEIVAVTHSVYLTMPNFSFENARVIGIVAG